MKFLRKQTAKIRLVGNGVKTGTLKNVTIADIGINEPLYFAFATALKAVQFKKQ